MPSSITHTAVLGVRRGTAEHLAMVLRDHRLGTREGTRALGVSEHALLVPRWFVDGTRLTQLARDNGIAARDRLPLPARGPDRTRRPRDRPVDRLERAVPARYSHLDLAGTVIHTDRVAATGPTGAFLWRPGKHRHHGGNVPVIAAPDGRPLWVPQVRPGREQDTTSPVPTA